MRRQESGISIVEIVLALAILAATMGAASLLLPRGGFAVQQAAKGLIADVQLARLEAVSGARYVRLAMEPEQNRYRLVEVVWTGSSWSSVAELKVVNMADQRTERVMVAADPAHDLFFDPRGNPIGQGAQAVVFSHSSGRSATVIISQQGLATL